MSESNNNATGNNNILGFLRQGVQKIGEFAKNRVMSVIGSPVASAEIPETNDPMVMGSHDTPTTKEKLGPPAPDYSKKNKPNLLARLNNFIVPPANAITAEEDAQQKRVLPTQTNTQGKTEKSSQSPKQLHAEMMKKTGINHKTFADVTEANNELANGKDPDIFAKIAALKEENPNYKIPYDSGAVNIAGIQKNFNDGFIGDKDKKEAISNGTQLVTKQTIASELSKIAAEVMSDALNETESSAEGKNKVNYQAELEKALKQAMAVMPIAISSSLEAIQKLINQLIGSIPDISYAGDMIRQLSAPTIKAKQKIMEKDQMPTKEQIKVAREEIAQQQEKELADLKKTAREKNVPIIPENLAKGLKDAEEMKIQTAMIKRKDADDLNPEEVVNAYLKIKNILEADEVDQGELASLVQIVTGNDEIQKLNDLASFPKLIKLAEAITNPYSDNPFSETVASINQSNDSTEEGISDQELLNLDFSSDARLQKRYDSLQVEEQEIVDRISRQSGNKDLLSNKALKKTMDLLKDLKKYPLSAYDPDNGKRQILKNWNDLKLPIDELINQEIANTNSSADNFRFIKTFVINQYMKGTDKFNQQIPNIVKTGQAYSELIGMGDYRGIVEAEHLNWQSFHAWSRIKQNGEENEKEQLASTLEKIYPNKNFGEKTLDELLDFRKKTLDDQLFNLNNTSFTTSNLISDPSLLVQGIIDFAGDELEAGEQNASSVLADNLSQDNLNFIDVTIPT